MPTDRSRRTVGAVSSLKYHLVLCPKYRRPVLVDAVAERLEKLLPDKANEPEATIHALDVMPDQVHLFVESDPTEAVADLVAQFKGRTAHAFRREFPHLRSRLPSLRSSPYYAGAVGHVSAAPVQRYIETQRGRA
jgi:putative transposase